MRATLNDNHIFVYNKKEEIVFAGTLMAARKQYGEKLVELLMDIKDYKSDQHDDKSQLEIKFNTIGS